MSSVNKGVFEAKESDEKWRREASHSQKASCEFQELYPRRKWNCWDEASRKRWKRKGDGWRWVWFAGGSSSLPLPFRGNDFLEGQGVWWSGCSWGLDERRRRKEGSWHPPLSTIRSRQFSAEFSGQQRQPCTPQSPQTLQGIDFEYNIKFILSLSYRKQGKGLIYLCRTGIWEPRE